MSSKTTKIHNPNIHKPKISSSGPINASKLCPASTIVYEQLLDKDKPKKRRYTGVGVLVITNYNNRPHFVLGREEFKSVKMDGEYVVPLYEEFGGGIQRRNLSLEENACFELQEETSNLLRFISNPSVLNGGVNRSYDIPFKESRMYKMYVIYIEDMYKVLHFFETNREKIKLQPTSYYKYKAYLEMDNLKLVPLEDITHVINGSQNYICSNVDDTYYNNNIENKLQYQQSTPHSKYRTRGYKGTLCVNDDTYISGRLVQFLNMGITATSKSGIFECLDIFQEGFITSRFKSSDGRGLGLRLSIPRIYLDYEQIATESQNAPDGHSRPHLRFLDGTRFCTAMVPP